jgi:hypothetical protein
MVTLSKAGYRSGTNDTGIVLQLGGASINANASGGYVAPTLPSPTPVSSTGSSTGGNNNLPTVQPPPMPGASTQPIQPVVSQPVIAQSALSLPRALSSWWVVLGAVLAVLAALALSLLPSRALAAAGAACRLEEDS